MQPVEKCCHSRCFAVEGHIFQPSRIDTSFCTALSILTDGYPHDDTFWAVFHLPPTGQSPRSICFTASGQTSGECCVSWSNPVSNAVDNYFITSIIDINNGCMTQSGQVSGLTGDTSIGNTCTVVCLSNRPTGCNN